MGGLKVYPKTGSGYFPCVRSSAGQERVRWADWERTHTEGAILVACIESRQVGYFHGASKAEQAADYLVKLSEIAGALPLDHEPNWSSICPDGDTQHDGFSKQVGY
jgi:hypothetical protein